MQINIHGCILIARAFRSCVLNCVFNESLSTYGIQDYVSVCLSLTSVSKIDFLR